jgi:hypothetical protein
MVSARAIFGRLGAQPLLDRLDDAVGVLEAAG